jgi:hypothetical protein
VPVHDWTRVDAGIFHHFHHVWIDENARALNRKLKGSDYYALAEQVAGGLGPDVLTLQKPLRRSAAGRGRKQRPGSVTLTQTPPRVRFRITNPPLWYASKKKAVTIRHVSEHNVVAELEIVSPGNKAGRSPLQAFVRKAQDLLAAGVHLSLVDLFPPTPRDPHGIHPVVGGDDDGADFVFDRAKPLTCAAYVGGPGAEAFVEPVAVGDRLPTLPLFLTGEEYVPVPLEATYRAAFAEVPDVWREVLTAKPG